MMTKSEHMKDCQILRLKKKLIKVMVKILNNFRWQYEVKKFLEIFLTAYMKDHCMKKGTTYPRKDFLINNL